MIWHRWVVGRLRFIFDRHSGRCMKVLTDPFHGFVSLSCLAAVVVLGVATLSFAAEINCDKAKAIFGLGDFHNDVRYHQQALYLCPGYIRPYELVGYHHYKQGNTDLAIANWQKAVELGSTNYKLYHLLAKMYLASGNSDKAYGYVSKALAIKPDYAQAISLESAILSSIDNHGPEIIIFEPKTGRGIVAIAQQGKIHVRGNVTDRSGVAWLKVNSILTSFDDAGDFVVSVPPGGAPGLQVEAADNRGNHSIVTIAVAAESIGGTEAPTERLDRLYNWSFAVIIGIDEYENWPPLEYAVADAIAIKAQLKAADFDDITLIVNGEATQRRILTELYDVLPRKVKREDRVLFYFAGHGHTHRSSSGKEQGYIIPADAKPGDDVTASISMEQIKRLVRLIPAKHILFVMDSCYSGLGLNRSSGWTSTTENYIRKVGSMRAVQIITAGGKGEQAQEYLGHGLFTEHLLKGLQGEADINKDKYLTVTELGAYLRPAVSNASGQEQTPLFGRLEGEGEFIFKLTGNDSR